MDFGIWKRLIIWMAQDPLRMDCKEPKEMRSYAKFIDSILILIGVSGIALIYLESYYTSYDLVVMALYSVVMSLSLLMLIMLAVYAIFVVSCQNMEDRVFKTEEEKGTAESKGR